jgi:outer membrane lipoprotein SlyB
MGLRMPRQWRVTLVLVIGVAVGAATGATAGLLHGLWSGNELDPAFVNFVERCLRERGYEPICWR